jgi:HEAT repeat protein
MKNQESHPPLPNELDQTKKSNYSGIMVPVVIILVSALIIVGVTKMVSNEKNYRDLVEELESKTFGNKWINAYELSKLIATSKIPKEEEDWLIEQLIKIYRSNADIKTKNFIIVALGQFQKPNVVPILLEVLAEPPSESTLFALSSLAGQTMPENFDFAPIKKFLSTNDSVLKQGAIFVLAQHQVKDSEPMMVSSLDDENINVRYAAATSLILFKNAASIPIITEILNLNYPEKTSQDGFNQIQIESLKLNVLNTALKTKWESLLPVIKHVAETDAKSKVSIKAQEFLNLLNN